MSEIPKKAIIRAGHSAMVLTKGANKPTEGSDIKPLKKVETAEHWRRRKLKEKQEKKPSE